MAVDTPPLYRERLWPSPMVWVATALVLLMVIVAVGSGLGWTTGGVFALCSTATVGYWLVSSSPTVAVTATALHAGRANLPLQWVGLIEPMDAPTTRAAMGRDADGRTYLVTRGWVTTAVRFVITDPADPTPDWIVGSRRPLELAAALAAARDDVHPSHAAG